ncbi:hypothetical protein PR003_g10100 [Phytophthora rubi]|nr:hypothetical protein PR003_g10100 [Phytophthora rubi]
MNYTYVIEHIAGPQNIWADMISRWAGNHDPVATAIMRVRAETPGEPNQHGETTEEVNQEVTEPIISTLPSRRRQLHLADVRRQRRGAVNVSPAVRSRTYPRRGTSTPWLHLDTS